MLRCRRRERCLKVGTRLTSDARRSGRGHRYRGQLYGRELKTKNAQRTVELHATLCATLRQIRPAKTGPARLRVTDLRGADPTRRVQPAAVRRGPKAGPADPAAASTM